MHHQEKDACAVTRNEGRKHPRGYSLESLSHVNETETIPHLDGLRLFTLSSTVTPPISSNMAERDREAESVNFIGNDKRATEEASALWRCSCLGCFLTSLRQTYVQPHIAVSPPRNPRSHFQNSTAYSRNVCVIRASSRFSAKLNCFHYLLTIWLSVNHPVDGRKVVPLRVSARARWKTSHILAGGCVTGCLPCKIFTNKFVA